MKTTFSLVGTILVSCSLCAEADIDPFKPPKPGEEVPPGADVDPFVPPQGVDEGGKLKAVHPWVDQAVEPGSGKGPEYITIGGWSYPGKDQVGMKDQIGILFRVDIGHYNDAIGHPDLNRGVALLSGRPEHPDLCTWLRPFLLTRDRAEFVVMGSRKQLNTMYLAFIPSKANHRYLYSLQRAVQEIVEKENKDHKTKPNIDRVSSIRSKQGVFLIFN